MPHPSVHPTARRDRSPTDGHRRPSAERRLRLTAPSPPARDPARRPRAPNRRPARGHRHLRRVARRGCGESARRAQRQGARPPGPDLQQAARRTGSATSGPVDPRRDQLGRDRLRHQPRRLLGAGAEGWMQFLPRAGKPSASTATATAAQGPQQPLGRDLRRRPTAARLRRSAATGTPRSSPTTTPSGTSPRSGARAPLRRRGPVEAPSGPAALRRRARPTRPSPGWSPRPPASAPFARHSEYVWGGSHGSSRPRPTVPSTAPRRRQPPAPGRRLRQPDDGHDPARRLGPNRVRGGG